MRVTCRILNRRMSSTGTLKVFSPVSEAKRWHFKKLFRSLLKRTIDACTSHLNMRRIILFSLFLFGAGCSLYAQDTPAVRDSAKLYKDIEQFSKKRKSTNFLH